ncbi:MAG: TIGR01777 family oxidoreductase [Nitrospinaceae bacterium]
MRVVVTGATGFIGNQLLLLLQEKGWDAAVLTRDAESAAVRLPTLCERIEWNPESGPPPENIFEGAGVVIHLAGENVAGGRWTASRKRSIMDSRILSARRLAETLQRVSRKPPVFISASAIGIYGDRGEEPLDETSSTSDGVLADVCRQWESEVLRVEASGIRAVVLRIGVVLGHDGGAMKMMLPPFRLGLGGSLGDGRQWMSWVHVRDLARLIIHAVETPALHGPVNAVSPNPATNREFSKILGKVLNRPAILPVPSFVLRTALGGMSELLLDSQKVSSRKVQESGFKFTYPQLKDALKVICDHPGHALRMEQWVPQPIDRVFSFFSDAKNLELITPPILQLKIFRQSTGEMRAGTKLDYRMKMHGFPVRWQSTIGDWVPNVRFSDRQSRGPYAYWNHVHEFIEKDGGTVLRDSAVYRLPFGVPGDIAAHWLVRRDLESIFAYRRKKIEELFGKENG